MLEKRHLKIKIYYYSNFILIYIASTIINVFLVLVYSNVAVPSFYIHRFWNIQSLSSLPLAHFIFEE